MERMAEVLPGEDPVQSRLVGLLQLSPPCEVAVLAVDASTFECYTL